MAIPIIAKHFLPFFKFADANTRFFNIETPFISMSRLAYVCRTLKIKKKLLETTYSKTV